MTNNLDCHSRLLFQSPPQYTSKHFETPAYPLIYNSYDLLLLLDKLHATRATVSEGFFLTILTALLNSIFNLEETGEASFAELLLCIRDKTSPGGKI